jgi:hypothetical protein
MMDCGVAGVPHKEQRAPMRSKRRSIVKRQHDERAGATVNPTLARLVRLHDEAWRIPGTNYRVGLDPLIGLIPGLGDVATAVLGYWILKEAKRLGVPTHRRALIIGYYVVDVLGGVLPVAGDVFDATYKAHKKALALIQKHLAER